MQSYLDSQIEQLQSIIDSSNKIVFFTGAGTSTESNIPDFRSGERTFSFSSKFITFSFTV